MAKVHTSNLFFLKFERSYLSTLPSINLLTNVAKTAVARELACFIWGMMTEHYA